MARPATGRRRYRFGLLLLAAVLLVAWLLVDGTGQDAPSDPQSARSSGATSGTDPESGLPLVEVADLPPEVAQTLDLVEAGGPFPEDRDGVTFENREDLLPDHPVGYYKEYTVPTPGSDDRGARRLVVGEAGEIYYTGDHYRSFSRIAR